jgi:ectoine hydroxylase-related dioxygenase (phytanoyl-CoA dioxygenase family)
MLLQQSQLTQFAKDGYCAAPHFFTADEVAAMQFELERMRRAGQFNEVARQEDSSPRQNLQLMPIYDKSDLYRALPFADKVKRAISMLIGERFILHLDQSFLKPARHGSGTAWHQDNAYFKIADPWKGVALWIAIHDATIANGTMHVIPGHVSMQHEHSKDPNGQVHIRCYPPEELAVPIELASGGALFFAYGTPHCTRGNTTDRDRAGVALHFLHEDFARADLVEPDRRTRPYVCGPNATGGLKEYGVVVDGTWDTEVRRVLYAAAVTA